MAAARARIRTADGGGPHSTARRRPCADCVPRSSRSRLQPRGALPPPRPGRLDAPAVPPQRRAARAVGGVRGGPFEPSSPAPRRSTIRPTLRGSRHPLRPPFRPSPAAPLPPAAVLGPSARRRARTPAAASRPVRPDRRVPRTAAGRPSRRSASSRSRRRGAAGWRFDVGPCEATVEVTAADPVRPPRLGRADAAAPTMPRAAAPPVTRVPAAPASVVAGEPWAPRDPPLPGEPEAFPETSGPVSAIAGAPDAGGPRSARASVSAQHTRPISPKSPIDETIVARRRRTPWSLVPPTGTRRRRSPPRRSSSVATRPRPPVPRRAARLDRRRHGLQDPRAARAAR